MARFLTSWSIVVSSAVGLATVVSGCGAANDLFGGKQNNSPSPSPQTAPNPGAPVDPSGVMAPNTTPAKLLDLAEGDSYLTNLATLIASTNAVSYHQAGQHAQSLTIAVLDNGFSGLNHSLGVRLPPTTKLVAGPLAQMEDTTHGVKLAEIVYAMATGKAAYDAALPGPRMLLVNTDGFSNLQAAVQTVIAEKADIVLYAQVWQFGGNFDGQGFINAEINKATAAGILWVNAAGNLGQSTFNSLITDEKNDPSQVVLPHQGRYVRFVVPRDQTPVTAVLAWNDFQNSKDYATTQDLDLVIEDGAQHVVASSRLHQSGPLVATAPVDPLYSAHARESITATLNVGTYYARIEDHSHNFTATSRFRLSIDGDSVELLDSSGGGSLGIPADNRSVLTVGASDVAYSSSDVDGQGHSTKPEIQLPSLVVFSDGETHYGTSSASAIAAASLALYMGAHPGLTRSKILTLLGSGDLATAKAASASAYTLRHK